MCNYCLFCIHDNKKIITFEPGKPKNTYGKQLYLGNRSL